MAIIDDELMEIVSGGWNVDDLTPEELEEFEKWGGILIDMQIKKRKGEATYTNEEMIAVHNKIQELNNQYREKYG